MTSIVIAAHNEAAVIGRCLDSLLADVAPGQLDVIVVPNGCSDSTAEIARSRGVRVVEVAHANKAAALNAGDQAALGFPRIYLDADVVVSSAGVRALCRALSGTRSRNGAAGSAHPALAAVPRRQLELDGRPWPVRAYFAVNSRLPVFSRGLFGRGLIALSEEGRSRFDRFPDLVADDLFLDSLFADGEKACVDDVVTRVATPFRTRDLVRRLQRVRRGNAAMRAAQALSQLDIEVRRADRSSWLRDVVLPEPRLLPAGLVYAGITVLAALLAKLSPQDDSTWQRDESTRSAALQSLDAPERR
jgi:glycosyltransferase involved in cell wall biosynthesis